MISTSNLLSLRESLAHILQVQLIYLNGVKTGKLEFKSMGVKQDWEMDKEGLLAEMNRIDDEMFTYLNGDAFESNSKVAMPWGKMNVLDELFFQRNHGSICHWSSQCKEVCFAVPRCYPGLSLGV